MMTNITIALLLSDGMNGAIQKRWRSLKDQQLIDGRRCPATLKTSL